nr:hypothetical protein [Tanacetum cinerariifolium]
MWLRSSTNVSFSNANVAVIGQASLFIAGLNVLMNSTNVAGSNKEHTSNSGVSTGNVDHCGVGLGPFLSLSDTFGSLHHSSLAANISDIERQMLDDKLMLLGDDGKPLNSCKSHQLELSSSEHIVVTHINVINNVSDVNLNIGGDKLSGTGETKSYANLLN